MNTLDNLHINSQHYFTYYSLNLHIPARGRQNNGQLAKKFETTNAASISHISFQ